MDEIKIEKKEVKKEKPKLWKKRVGILGKQIPVVVLLLVAVGGLGSAVLLAYFGTITTTADVQQAVTLLEVKEHTIPEPAPDGERFCYLQKVDNKASVDIGVTLNTGCSCTGEQCGSCPEIVTGTGFYSISETREMILENKYQTNWESITTDGVKATLTFDPVGPTFKGILTTTGLDPKEYALIYYPDQLDRFDPLKWNGAGGKVIIKFTDDATNLPIDVDLGINLPNTGDWNINPDPDYCGEHNGFDSYLHCKGTKLWIVETSDLTDGNLPLKNWNPSHWLFETDLIVYSDCDLTSMEYPVDMEMSGPITALTTKSRDITPFLVCYNFPIRTIPGTYTLTTNVVPATQ